MDNKASITNILSDILRSRGSQAMTFGQLIKYMRNIFFKISYTKWGGETSPRLLKKSKLNIYLDQQSKTSYGVFSLYVQVEDYQNILKLRCQTRVFNCVFLSCDIRVLDWIYIWRLCDCNRIRTHNHLVRKQYSTI